MEENLQHAVEADDLPAVARGLTRAATFVPDPSWNAGEQGWATVAKAGAAAATAGDLAAAKQTCKTCHKAWRSKYKEQFRKRPVPN
jgi:cytochrome c553